MSIRGTERDQFGREFRLAQIGKADSAAEMERRLLALSEQYVKTRDPKLREEYRSLHALWAAMKP